MVFFKWSWREIFSDSAVREQLMEYCRLEYCETIDSIVYYDNYDHNIELSFYFESEPLYTSESPHSMTFVISDEVDESLEYLLRSAFIHTLHTAEEIETTLSELTARQKPSDYKVFQMDGYVLIYTPINGAELLSLIAGDGT